MLILITNIITFSDIYDNRPLIGFNVPTTVLIWSPFERTFFDVRVTHPTAPSNVNLTSAQLYQRNENEKKRKYGERCRQSEKVGFCCLVHSTTGAVVWPQNAKPSTSSSLTE